MRRKVYKIRLEIDETAIQKRSHELDMKFIKFCEENEIEVDDANDPMFDRIMESTLKSAIMDRYALDIQMAIQSAINTKGHAIIDGMEVDRSERCLFEYPVEAIRENDDGDLVGCYLLVDDPDVAMLLKLQFQ